MPDLLQTYPQYEDKIERSRKAGYSDEEIASFISNYEQKKPSFTGALLKRAKPEMTLSAQKKAKSLAEKEFWSKLVPAEALFKSLGTASTALWSQVGSVFKDKTAGELVQEDTHLGDVARPVLPIRTPQISMSPELQKFALDMIGDPAVWLGGFTGPGLITGLAKKAGKKGLKKVVEKIPKWEIPKLSSTNDAIKEGLKVKGNKKAIETLRKKEQELIGLIKEETNIEEKAQLSFQKQFHREAREAATGEGGIGKALKEKESPLKKIIEQAKKELDPEKVGRSKLLKSKVVKATIDEKRVSEIRGAKVNMEAMEITTQNLPEGAAQKVIKNLKEEKVISVQEKFTLAQEAKHKAPDIVADAVEGKSNELINYILKSKKQAGVGIRAERDVNRIVYEGLIEEIKKYSPKEQKAAKKLLESMGIGEKGDFKPSTMQKIVEWATMI